jgi:broad specificity phosphatase PhoE
VTSADGSWCTEAMLILVRHGESTGNAARLLAGRIDLPLTERGIDQAKSVGAVLDGVTRVISSPLGRARATAEALGLGLPVEIDDRWVEVDYGSFDGRPLAEVPAALWREWRSDPDFRPPGGESLAEVGSRVAGACEELFAVDGEGARSEGHVVVVSHVSPIKAATCWAVGLPDVGAWRLYLATASITRIGQGPAGVTLQGYNETPWTR